MVENILLSVNLLCVHMLFYPLKKKKKKKKEEEEKQKNKQKKKKLRRLKSCGFLPSLD